MMQKKFSQNKITNTQNILTVDSLSKSFGGIKAQSDVSFSVKKGCIYGLIGPNGAGKTTLFNLITGIYKPDKGKIIFNDINIIGKVPYNLVAAGIARTFQNVELFESMTVIENVLVGSHVKMKSGFWGAITRIPSVIREESQAEKKAMELIRFTGLEQDALKPCCDLPFGRQRLVEIARALASEPKLLLLDEPAAGLNAVETEILGKLLREIKATGITIILVEHDMSLTMGISDQIIVLDRGKKLAEGTPRDIQKNVDVMEAYLGT